MELTRIQQNAVDTLVSYFDLNTRVKIDFKSPTGSGKTLMATNVISTLMQNFFSEKLVFVIATPSSSSLPRFFEQKIIKYKRSLPFSKFEVEYIESPSNNKKDTTESTPKIIPEINKVYIFGKATFGKGRIFTERNVLDDFVQVCNESNYKVVYIRDEAHIGGKVSSDKGTRKFEELMQNNAHFVINMTATPDYKSDTKKVIIKESYLNNPLYNEDKWLLKTNLIPLLKDDIKDTDLLNDAITQFKLIRREYKSLESEGVFIRPAMLIQVDNEPSNKIKKVKYKEDLLEIKKTLNDSGLAWVQYFGNSEKDSNRIYKGNFSLEEVTHNMSEIDVIIFKIGPSTGWDIPRACLLLQLRNVSSTKLNIQTIGRIKRNPYIDLKKNTITDNYYIYSNAPSLDEDVVVYNYKIKNEYLDEKLAIIKIKNKSLLNKASLRNAYKNKVKEYLESIKYQIIQNIKNNFILNKSKNLVLRIESYKANNHSVYIEIDNVFIFLKEVKKLKLQNSKIFKYYEDEINNFYLDNIKGAVFSDGINIQIEHYYYTLFKDFVNDFKRTLRQNIDFTPEYKIEVEKYNPSNYVEVYHNIDNDGDTTQFSSYLFDLRKNGEGDFLQPLDSIPEATVFGKLSMEMYKYDSSIKIWCKNMISSNICSEYIDDDLTVKRSFFDFVVKFSNGNYLYIEVKSKDDIDSQKTDMLKKSYEDYFKNKEITLFDKPIVISVWIVGGKQIIQESFYDTGLIQDDLNDMNYSQLIGYLSKN